MTGIRSQSFAPRNFTLSTCGSRKLPDISLIGRFSSLLAPRFSLFHRRELAPQVIDKRDVFGTELDRTEKFSLCTPVEQGDVKDSAKSRATDIAGAADATLFIPHLNEVARLKRDVQEHRTYACMRWMF
jgi:hypothetical protein